VNTFLFPLVKGITRKVAERQHVDQRSVLGEIGWGEAGRSWALPQAAQLKVPAADQPPGKPRE
jgi:hypothetical protein